MVFSLNSSTQIAFIYSYGTVPQMGRTTSLIDIHSYLHLLKGHAMHRTFSIEIRMAGQQMPIWIFYFWPRWNLHQFYQCNGIHLDKFNGSASRKLINVNFRRKIKWNKNQVHKLNIIFASKWMKMVSYTTFSAFNRPSRDWGKQNNFYVIFREFI